MSEGGSKCHIWHTLTREGWASQSLGRYRPSRASRRCRCSALSLLDTMQSSQLSFIALRDIIAPRVQHYYYSTCTCTQYSTKQRDASEALSRWITHTQRDSHHAHTTRGISHAGATASNAPTRPAPPCPLHSRAAPTSAHLHTAVLYWYCLPSTYSGVRVP